MENDRGGWGVGHKTPCLPTCHTSAYNRDNSKNCILVLETQQFSPHYKLMAYISVPNIPKEDNEFNFWEVYISVASILLSVHPVVQQGHGNLKLLSVTLTENWSLCHFNYPSASSLLSCDSTEVKHCCLLLLWHVESYMVSFFFKLKLKLKLFYLLLVYSRTREKHSALETWQMSRDALI